MGETKKTFLSLGSNIGDRLYFLKKAIHFIKHEIGEVRSISSVYETDSWGFKSDYFLNVCIELNISIEIRDLLKRINYIENKLGNYKISKEGYKNRTIDIDILFYGTDSVQEDDLKVPHPLMHLRKFVLSPLSEIAPNLIHPKLNRTIKEICESSKDSSGIKKTNYSIEQISSSCEALVNELRNKYKFIAIEGNIGSGKTSLAGKISADSDANLILERFDDNPFLPKFYEDKSRYAFPLETSFLTERYQHLIEKLAHVDIFNDLVISDYYINKSLIFGKINLSEDEFNLYRKIFYLMSKEILKPDLYVYLYQTPAKLLKYIKRRGRNYEQKIEESYLSQIHGEYIKHIRTQKDIDTLVLDVSELDFVEENNDYLKILEELVGTKKGHTLKKIS